MAVTKTHPIKSTLKAAIDYICNPDKTDGRLLVSAYGCAAETADIEFAWTRRHAIDKGTNLGRHLIQAFEPGEVSPEEAHEIGMQLAKEILGGKYEFVLTTHIDKGHIHNHLIFNAVSFTDHKHYHSNKRSYHEIRRTSDRLCKEHGLSVIVPGQDKCRKCGFGGRGRTTIPTAAACSFSAFSHSCLSPKRHAPADGQTVNLGIIFGLFSPYTLRLGNGWCCGIGKSLSPVLRHFGTGYFPRKNARTQLSSSCSE